LLIVALATAYEPTRIFVEPFIGQADVGPINVTPGPADVAANVEAGPTREWRNRIKRIMRVEWIVSTSPPS